MKLKLWILTVGVIAPATLFATAKFPHLCRVSGLRYKHQHVIFFPQHTAKPRLYVIHNTSKYALWLTHEKKNPSASAGWDSQVLPNRWSSILVTQKNFYLGCHYQSKSGAMVKLPCKNVIEACQYSYFYSKNPIGGGYWVAENLPKKALEPRIGQRGFSLRK